MALRVGRQKDNAANVSYGMRRRYKLEGRPARTVSHVIQCLSFHKLVFLYS